jgi:hypothetical protein
MSFFRLVDTWIDTRVQDHSECRIEDIKQLPKRGLDMGARGKTLVYFAHGENMGNGFVLATAGEMLLHLRRPPAI